MAIARDYPKPDLRSEIYTIIHPEHDEEDGVFRELPSERLEKVHNLDASYLTEGHGIVYEGSTSHPHTRQCMPSQEDLHLLTRNADIAGRLFLTALELLGDSIVEYHGRDNRKGQIHYYPPVVVTFWAGFETFVRYLSELMIITVKNVPEIVKQFLREKESYIDKGEIKVKTKYQTSIGRYEVLMKYGYGYEIDRGDRYWQNLTEAQKLRDYYTHFNLGTPKAVSTSEVFKFMEELMLSIIKPSCDLGRTVFPGIYRLYEAWEKMNELYEEFIEQPVWLDLPFEGGYLFRCNFENVDTTLFPNHSFSDWDYEDFEKRFGSDTNEQ